MARHSERRLDRLTDGLDVEEEEKIRLAPGFPEGGGTMN